MTLLFVVSIIFRREQLGMKRWEHERAKWTHPSSYHENVAGSTATNNRSSEERKADKIVDMEEIVEVICSNRWKKTTDEEGNDKSVGNASFRTPVPLSCIIEILVDIWENEGFDV